MTDSQTFLCDSLILGPGGFTVREPCRSCGGAAPLQRGRGLSICPACCESGGDLLHVRRGMPDRVCVFCGTTEGRFQDDI